MIGFIFPVKGWAPEWSMFLYSLCVNEFTFEKKKLIYNLMKSRANEKKLWYLWIKWCQVQKKPWKWMHGHTFLKVSIMTTILRNKSWNVPKEKIIHVRTWMHNETLAKYKTGRMTWHKERSSNDNFAVDMLCAKKERNFRTWYSLRQMSLKETLWNGAS